MAPFIDQPQQDSVGAGFSFLYGKASESSGRHAMQVLKGQHDLSFSPTAHFSTADVAGPGDLDPEDRQTQLPHSILHSGSTIPFAEPLAPNRGSMWALSSQSPGVMPMSIPMNLQGHTPSLDFGAALRHNPQLLRGQGSVSGISPGIPGWNGGSGSEMASLAGIGSGALMSAMGNPQMQSMPFHLQQQGQQTRFLQASASMPMMHPIGAGLSMGESYGTTHPTSWTGDGTRFGSHTDVQGMIPDPSAMQGVPMPDSMIGSSNSLVSMTTSFDHRPVTPTSAGLPRPASMPALLGTSAVIFSGPPQQSSKRKGRGGRTAAADPRLDPEMDPKRAKRILANRQSAARSKSRQRGHLDQLEHNQNVLAHQKTELLKEAAFLRSEIKSLQEETPQLDAQLKALEEHCLLQEALQIKLLEQCGHVPKP